ncbi:MAG: hypothetical protein UIC63_08740, partial [Bacteroidaceae bacterium]|nr:hypothetical protein [Bacteroidaceae bacterium]
AKKSIQLTAGSSQPQPQKNKRYGVGVNFPSPCKKQGCQKVKTADLNKILQMCKTIKFSSIKHRFCGQQSKVKKTTPTAVLNLCSSKLTIGIRL